MPARYFAAVDGHSSDNFTGHLVRPGESFDVESFGVGEEACLEVNVGNVGSGDVDVAAGIGVGEEVGDGDVLSWGDANCWGWEATLREMLAQYGIKCAAGWVYLFTNAPTTSGRSGLDLKSLSQA